jgi:hypothetical protein
MIDRQGISESRTFILSHGCWTDRGGPESLPSPQLATAVQVRVVKQLGETVARSLLKVLRLLE